MEENKTGAANISGSKLNNMTTLDLNSIISKYPDYKEPIKFMYEDMHNSAINDNTLMAMLNKSSIDVSKNGYSFMYPALYEDKISNYFNKKVMKPIDGKKYIKPTGQNSRLYRPVILPIETLLNKDIPIMITEGEKKAIKATQEGFPCIAISGVTSWKKSIHYDELLKMTPEQIVDYLKDKEHSLMYESDADEDIIPDLLNIKWEGKTVILCFDSDMWKKEQVKRALYIFACYLMGSQKAKVKILTLPDGNAKGIDDFIIANGVEAFRELYNNAKEITLQQAQKILSGESTKKLGFPINVFKPELATLFTNLAKKMDAPLEYIAVAALVGASTVMDGFYQIDILGDGSWVDSPILWGVLVGKPSQKKTPCLGLVTKILSKYDLGLAEEYRQKKAKYEQEMLQYKIDLKQYQKLRKNNQYTELPIPPQKPKYKMLTVQNTTVETLVMAINANEGRGIGVIVDELASFFNCLGQYKSGRGDDEEYYLQSWKKQPFHYIRKTNNEDYYVTPSHNILGSIQPAKLNKILFHGNFETTNGMIERWLYTCTDYEETGIVDNVSEDCSLAPLEAIYDRLYNSTTLKTYKFSNKAKEEFKKYCQTVVMWKKAPATPELMQTYIQKQTDYVARFSLILHCLNGCKSDEISHTTVENAIRLSHYFIESFRRVASIVTGISSNSLAMDTLEWLRVKRHKEISPSKLQKNRSGTFRTTQMARLALEILSDCGYGRLVRVTNGGMKFKFYL